MAIDFDAVFGVHERALKIREARTEVLASNIANADTPGYKARDIDFRELINNASLSVRMKATNPGHMASAGEGVFEQHMKYRAPSQPSLDGNTVDPHIEKAEFGENSLRYEATLMFLSRKIQGIKSALKGE